MTVGTAATTPASTVRMMVLARRAVRTLLGSRAACVGLTIFFLYVLSSLFAPLIAPHDPSLQNPGLDLHGPSAQFWLGNDQFGRDILSRVIYAGRESLYVGVVGVAFGALIGATLGVLAGYFGSYLDAVLMRVVDLGLGFPAIIIGVVVVAIRGPGATNLAIAIALYNVPIFIRILRSVTVDVKSRAFVEVAAATGVGDGDIIRRHIVPNVLPTLLIQAGIAMPTAIILEAGLSYLGLGARPPTPSLGGMLSDARAYLGVTPWFAIAPGVSLSILVVALNLLVDGLRDMLDPRQNAARRESEEV